MITLAFDTTSKTASVALLDNTSVIISMTLNTGLTHSEQLMPMIDDILLRTKYHCRDLDLIAVTHGPGSFTGIRIGLATAKGLMLPLSIPVIGISSLDVLAQEGKLWKGLVCPIMNARRQEVYAAVYESNGNGIIRKSDYQAISLQNLLLSLPDDKDVLFTGDGVEANPELLLQTNRTNYYFTEGSSRYIKAELLGLMAIEQYDKTSIQCNTKLEPFYLRQSEAVIKWEKDHPGKSLNV